MIAHTLASRRLRHKFLDDYKEQGYALLRTVTGYLFIWHGTQKFLDFPNEWPWGELTPLQTVIDENPKNANAWNYMGYSLRHLKQYDDALAAYRKALKIKPKHKGAPGIPG